ncbi:MAG: hypothetical protein V1867_05995 [Candidatus Falkowbacteria bacterium]
MPKNKVNSIFLVWLMIFIMSGILTLGVVALRPVLAVFGDYDRAEASLSIDDWNFLNDDFVLRDGDTMAGDLNMNNVGISNLAVIPADETSAASAGYVNSRINSSAGGTTYINWGRGDCAAGDTVLYGGFGFGATYSVMSGGDNDICVQLPADAEFAHTGAIADRMYPSMSGGSPWMPAGYDPARSFVRCAVCYRNQSACYTGYGTHNCNKGNFTDKAYDGYVAAGINESHTLSRERNCVNRNFDNTGGAATTWGAAWYGSRIENNFGQAGYDNLVFIRCAVCCN